MSDNQIQFTQADLLLVIGELELTRRALLERIEQLEARLAARETEDR